MAAFEGGVLSDNSDTHHAECCYETSLEDISMPAVEAQLVYPTKYDYARPQEAVRPVRPWPYHYFSTKKNKKYINQKLN